MRRKYRLGDGLLTMADLEAMNKEDFSTIGAFVHEFKKKARKVHGISEEATELLTGSEATELTKYGEGSERLTWATIDKRGEEGSLDQVEQHQMRLQRRKRNERDATAYGTPGVKRIVTDVLAALGYDNKAEIQKRGVLVAQGRVSGAVDEEAGQEDYSGGETGSQVLTKAQRKQRNLLQGGHGSGKGQAPQAIAPPPPVAAAAPMPAGPSHMGPPPACGHWVQHCQSAPWPSCNHCVSCGGSQAHTGHIVPYSSPSNSLWLNCRPPNRPRKPVWPGEGAKDKAGRAMGAGAKGVEEGAAGGEEEMVEAVEEAGMVKGVRTNVAKAAREGAKGIGGPASTGGTQLVGIVARKEVVEVQEEEDEGDDEEDERLRQEEDRRAEQRAKKRGIQGGAEPSLHDGVPKRKKYAVWLEEGFDVERMVDKLLEGHNDLMNLKDILASAPRLRGELKGRLSQRLVPNVHLSSILPREIEWTEVGTRIDWKCVACGLVDLKVRDQPSIAMVDTGTETNIIRERDATMLGLEVDHLDHGVLHGANCKGIFCGTASNVMVEIGRDIDQFLGLLKEHNLTASGPKSKHCMRETTILGFVCNEKGRRPDVKKTDKIQEWPVPFQSITNVRSFLGTCGFWRTFVKDFATKTEHLRKLVRQDQKWVWGEEQEKAVERMKGEFREGGLVLGAPNNEATEEKSFVVETDAGPTALGGVLIQADADGKERPLRFESRTLNTTERNYSQFKKETLAVLHCLRTFRNYIFGRRLILRVDPTVLACSLKSYTPSDPTIARWLTYIWMFNFEFERIPGDKNRADGLSRINWDRANQESTEDTPPVNGFLDQEEDVCLHINDWSLRVPSCVTHPIWPAPRGYERKEEMVLKPFQEEDPWGSRDVGWMMKLALAGTDSLAEEVKTIEEGSTQVEENEQLMGGMYLLTNTLLQGDFKQRSSTGSEESELLIPESQDDEFEEEKIREEASRLGKGSVEPTCYVTLEEPLDPETETDMRDREEPQNPEMAAGPPDPVRPQGGKVITVGDDTPPRSPVPEPAQHSWPKGIPEPDSEEIPESSPEATSMLEQEAEAEGQGVCERARGETPLDLPSATHVTKSLAIEEHVPAELPPAVPCMSERMGAEASTLESQGPRVKRTPRETREEKSARVRVRLDEIHARQAEMEVAGIEPTPPVEPKTSEQRIDELWARKICKMIVTSFQWYNQLSNELRIRELEVEHLTTQLAEERARSQAREVEWERRFGEMGVVVDRLSAAWEASQAGRAGVNGQGRGRQASPGQGAAVEVPRQAEPMQEVPLDAAEEQGGAQELLMAMSTERRGSRLHELAATMGIGTPQEGPQRLDAPEHAPRLGELRAELGSWATGTDSGGPDSRQQQQQEVMSEPTAIGGSQTSGACGDEVVVTEGPHEEGP
ncbi:hypothetical protein CBR_g32374 [Chara braunii]|uniref:Reverse transcriptase RNase H-like domain-containing protein n=1 Tax=Chara braunii TaxID=69332 RepID=A0A388JYE0_CHABU|nr:hypothetical protein CBR_g32374 [Chara braunii]|eukprot:GBG62785.1 hypothetical protein CBR_g32374 [Chara braunii]